MGNPLYLSPLYQEGHDIEVGNNRFVAWHLGLSGRPLKHLDYRVLATYQTGYGTYHKPYLPERHQFSMLAEACYKLMQGWNVKGPAHQSHRLEVSPHDSPLAQNSQMPLASHAIINKKSSPSWRGFLLITLHISFRYRLRQSTRRCKRGYRRGRRLLCRQRGRPWYSYRS